MTRGTIQRDQIYVYAQCEHSGCDEQNALVYECGDSLLCAWHMREYARANPVKQSCDRCGSQKNVVRDPSHRRNEYLCFSCHEETGFFAKDSVTSRAIRSAVRSIINPNMPALECYAKGHGTECEGTLKPRSAWGGKILCNKHGRVTPKN